MKSAGLNEEVVERLSHLVAGYESPYDLELLATLHYRLKQARISTPTPELVSQLSAPNQHRRNSYTKAEIYAAAHRLKEDLFL